MKTLIVVLIASTAILVTADQQNNFSRNLIRAQNDKSADSSTISSNISEESAVINKQLAKYSSSDGLDNYLEGVNARDVFVAWHDFLTRDFPLEAAYGGYDGNDTYFLIRAQHFENSRPVGVLLGKFSPVSQYASISYNGTEYRKSDFELFLNVERSWSNGRERYDHRDLVPGGNSEYFCRFKPDPSKESIMPGRLDFQRWKCRIPYNGTELITTKFDTFRRPCAGRSGSGKSANSGLTWRKWFVYWNNTMVGVPYNAVYGGFSTSGPIFSMISNHSTPTGNILMPGVYYPTLRKAYVDFENQIYEKDEFGILIYNSYSWQRATKKSTLFDIDGHHFCTGKWNEGTVHIPGRYDPVDDVCYIIYNGHVSKMTDFKLLVKSCYYS